MGVLGGLYSQYRVTVQVTVQLSAPPLGLLVSFVRSFSRSVGVVNVQRTIFYPYVRMYNRIPIISGFVSRGFSGDSVCTVYVQLAVTNCTGWGFLGGFSYSSPVGMRSSSGA